MIIGSRIPKTSNLLDGYWFFCMTFDLKKLFYLYKINESKDYGNHVENILISQLLWHR